MTQTKGGNGEQMVCFLSVSINVISRDLILCSRAPAEFTAEKILTRLRIGLESVFEVVRTDVCLFMM